MSHRHVRCLALSSLLTLAVAGAMIASPSLRAQAPAQARVTVVKVTGDSHKLALRSDGTVIGWGQWVRGQLGPVTPLMSGPPFGTAGPVPISLSGKAIDVATRANASYALLEDGSVWAWGDARDGLLGTGNSAQAPLLATSTTSMQYRGAEQALRVPMPAAKKIYGGSVGTFALLTDGTVIGWPSRGDAGSTPAPIAGLSDIVDLAPAWSHVLALTKDGHVWAWGSNQYGVLGHAPTALDEFSATPVLVPDLSNVSSIAAAGDASFALKSDGTVWVWGTNGQAQFGNGQRASHPTSGIQGTPQRVPGVANVAAISAVAGRHVMALLKDGTLRAWGNTDWGQIGTGLSATFVLTAVTPKITGVKSVFAVSGNTFAVKTDGTFWAWGNGGPGEWPLARKTALPTMITIP